MADAEKAAGEKRAAMLDKTLRKLYSVPARKGDAFP